MIVRLTDQIGDLLHGHADLQLGELAAGCRLASDLALVAIDSLDRLAVARLDIKELDHLAIGMHPRRRTGEFLAIACGASPASSIVSTIGAIHLRLVCTLERRCLALHAGKTF